MREKSISRNNRSYLVDITIRGFPIDIPVVVTHIEYRKLGKWQVSFIGSYTVRLLTLFCRHYFTKLAKTYHTGLQLSALLAKVLFSVTDDTITTSDERINVFSAWDLCQVIQGNKIFPTSILAKIDLHLPLNVYFHWNEINHWAVLNTLHVLFVLKMFSPATDHVVQTLNITLPCARRNEFLHSSKDRNNFRYLTINTDICTRK